MPTPSMLINRQHMWFHTITNKGTMSDKAFIMGTLNEAPKKKYGRFGVGLNDAVAIILRLGMTIKFFSDGKRMQPYVKTPRR